MGCACLHNAKGISCIKGNNRRRKSSEREWKGHVAKNDLPIVKYGLHVIAIVWYDQTYSVHKHTTRRQVILGCISQPLIPTCKAWDETKTRRSDDLQRAEKPISAPQKKMKCELWNWHHPIYLLIYNGKGFVCIICRGVGKKQWR